MDQQCPQNSVEVFKGYLLKYLKITPSKEVCKTPGIMERRTDSNG